MSYKPEGYTSLTPYLIVADAAGFRDFLRNVFQATFLNETEDQGRIVHASARLDDAILEFSAGNDTYRPMPMALHYYVPDIDAVHSRALAAGSTELHPPMDQPYGERSSAIRDPFGNHWYIATYLPPAA